MKINAKSEGIEIKNKVKDVSDMDWLKKRGAKYPYDLKFCGGRQNRNSKPHYPINWKVWPTWLEVREVFVVGDLLGTFTERREQRYNWFQMYSKNEYENKDDK